MQHWGAFAKPLLQWISDKYYIFRMYVCGLSYPVCKAHEPNYIVMWPVWLYHIFSLYLINGMTFGKKLLITKIVLIVSTIFVCNISHWAWGSVVVKALRY
jgi:hypothetical protein